MTHNRFAKLMLGLAMLGFMDNAGYAEVINSTAIASQTQDSPQEVVKMHLNALRKGDVDTAMRYVLTEQPMAIREHLLKNLPNYKRIISVRYDETQYNPDGTQAMVIVTFHTKDYKKPIALPFILVKTALGWKALAEPLPTTDHR